MGGSKSSPRFVRILRRLRRLAWIAAGVLLVYAGLAYLAFPLLWRHYDHMPRLETVPKKTYKSGKVYGDPLNFVLVGNRDDVLAALTAAAWRPADSKTVGADLRLIERGLLARSYPTAPVSDLYLFGRPQDLAFEQADVRSVRRRHHVRFWLAPDPGGKERPVWLGAATFDRSLGLSRRTGQITHHIDPNIDAERDKLAADLEAAGRLVSTFQVTGIGPTLRDTNGEKDWYFTDGEMTVGVLTAAAVTRTAPPERPASPAHVRLTNRAWKALGRILGSDIGTRAGAPGAPGKTP